MSFPRAKRFNYKNPDIDLSPADFNISRSLTRGCHFQKGPRFSKKNSNSDDSNDFVCPRWNNCCRQKPLECSTPHKRREHRIDSNANTREMDSTKNDCSQASSSRDKAEEKAADEKPFQDTVVSNFIDLEAFIEDDYDSYFSSEELSECLKTFQKLLDKLNQEKSDRRSENHFLRTFGELEKTLEKLRDVVNGLIGKRHTEQIGRHQNRQMKKINNERSLCDKCDTSRNSESQNRYYDTIKETIKEAMAKLFDDLVIKIKKMHVFNDRKLSQLISAIEASNSSIEKIYEELCEKVATGLTQKIMDMLNSQLGVRTLDLNISETSDEIVEEIKCIYQMNHDYFNYENICKVLSDQLQASKDEVEALKRDAMDITIKYNGTQKVLEGHASIFMKLRDEIAAIKRDFTDNQ